MFRNFGTREGYLIGRMGEKVSNPNKDLIAWKEYAYKLDIIEADILSKELRKQYIADMKVQKT